MRVEAPAVDPLRLIIGSPAPSKDVGIVLVLGSARGVVVPIIPFSLFLAGVVAILQDCVVPVQPADMILVQRPLGVEGDIFVGGDVCLVGIGRAGAVLRRVPTGEIIVRTGEAIGGQVGRLVGLHGLRAHGSLAAVGIKGDDRVLGPLGIQGGIRAEIHGLPVGIGLAGTVLRRVPTGKGIILTGKCVVYQLVTNAGVDAHGLHAARTAVRVKGNGDFVAPERPFAVGVHIGVAGLGTGSPCIGVAGVVQLGGGDGDSHRLIAICIILIGFGFRTGCALLNVLAGAVAGADIRTALGGVDGANRRYAAVYIHLRINQVVIGAVVCLTRRIGHGLKLAGAPDKVVGVPLIAVIEIDVLSVCNRQASAFGNVDLNACQQSCILIDGHIAGLDIDGDVIGDGQHIACRVDTLAREL